jgi:uncharacterized membrane protein
VETGPIQLLIVAFPGNRFKGEILPELERLKREEIVRVLDLLVVRKDGQGKVMVTTGTDMDWEEATAFGSYIGGLAGFAASGPGGMERGSMIGAAELADGHYFDEEDVFRVTRSLPDDTTAALVLIEHRWAIPLLDAVARADGVELSNDWIRADQLLTVEPKQRDGDDEDDAEDAD